MDSVPRNPCVYRRFMVGLCPSSGPLIEGRLFPMAAEIKDSKGTELPELPDMFKDSVDALNRAIAEHNKNVTAVKSAMSGQKDVRALKSEIFEQRYKENKRLAVLRKEYDRLSEQLEKVVEQAYAVIDEAGLMPKALSPEEIEKLKKNIGSSGADLRKKIEALGTMEGMFNLPEGTITSRIDDIQTLRGVGVKAKSSGSGETGIKRPRFSLIEINGVTEDESGNTVYKEVDGKRKYTLSFAARYLNARHPSINVTSSQLQEKYFGDKTSQDELPDVHEFDFPVTYKDENGNDQTIVYHFKATK